MTGDGPARPEIVLHVAVARNGVIGRAGGLPWRLSTDLRRLKALTTGKPIIMGRKTWDGLGRPLPNRFNIVITRYPDFAAPGAAVVTSLDEALELARGRARADGTDQICVIGGGEIFRMALPLADRLYLTEVLADIDGDTHFPPVDRAVWRETASEDVPAGEKDSHPTRHSVHVRRDRG
jgi:dihydrofolate reductase